MTQQGDLFAPPEPTPLRVCGTCVTLNIGTGDAGGDCSRMGHRERGAPACVEWFATTELKRPLYGKSKSK